MSRHAQAIFFYPWQSLTKDQASEGDMGHLKFNVNSIGLNNQMNTDEEAADTVDDNKSFYDAKTLKLKELNKL